jgi:hypothetical protein
VAHVCFYDGDDSRIEWFRDNGLGFRMCNLVWSGTPRICSSFGERFATYFYKTFRAAVLT